MSALFPDFHAYDATALGELIRRGEISPPELLDEVLRRIASVNDTLNCICHPHYEGARAAAQAPSGSGPFSGLPLFLKDLILWHKGTPLTSGSRFMRGFSPDRHSEVTRRLLESGMIFTARTASSELGMYPTVESELYGTTRNPWNPAYTTGGSSGGAAALVAARIFPLADANDGGGSVRGPAALCGVVGLKPSRGRHSFAPFGEWRFGMGVCGCMTLSVRDAAHYLDIIAGGLPGDPHSLPLPEGGFAANLRGRRKKWRIALGVSSLPVHPDCAAAAQEAAELCESLGHEVSLLELPSWFAEAGLFFQKTGSVWTAFRLRQQMRCMGRAPRRDELEAATWRAWLDGQRITALEHERTLEEMRVFVRRVCSVLAPYDVVLTPTLAAPGFKLGEMKPTLEQLRRPEGPWLEHWEKYGRFITLLNVTGQPGLSLPFRQSAEGLPLGVQLIGRMGEEETLLNLAADLEEARPWIRRLPPIAAHS